MTVLPDNLQARINNARSLNGISHTEPMVSYKNIGSLLLDQTEKYEDRPFLIFYTDDGHRQEYSYREFYEEVCRTANTFGNLDATLGLRQFGHGSHGNRVKQNR